MTTRIRLLFALLALCVVPVPPALAAVPGVMPYLGRLTDASGNPLNGSQTITFSLYADTTGASALWTETRVLTVANGLFSVNLGQATPIPASVFTGVDRYLGIKVGSDQEMRPLQRLGTVAYAFRSAVGPGIAHVTGSGGPPPVGQYGNLNSVTVTFPAAGYALVTGNLSYLIQHAAGVDDNFVISINDVYATPDGGSNVYLIVSSATAMALQNTGVATRVFPVTAGSKTFYFVGWHVSGNIGVSAARLTVQYFPDAIGTINSEPQPGPVGAPAATAAAAGAKQ